MPLAGTTHRRFRRGGSLAAVALAAISLWTAQAVGRVESQPSWGLEHMPHRRSVWSAGRGARQLLWANASNASVRGARHAVFVVCPCPCPCPCRVRAHFPDHGFSAPSVASSRCRALWLHAQPALLALAASQAADLAEFAVTATQPGVALQLLLTTNETGCERAAIADDAVQLRDCLQTAQVVATRAVSGTLRMSWANLADDFGLPSAYGPPGGWPILVATMSTWFVASSPGYYSFVVLGSAQGHVRAFANGTEQAIRKSSFGLNSDDRVTHHGTKYSSATEFKVVERLDAGETIALEIALLSPTAGSPPVFVYATRSSTLETSSKSFQSLETLGAVRIPESLLVAHAPPLCERGVLQFTAQHLMLKSQLQGSAVWAPWLRLADEMSSDIQLAMSAALACEAPGVACRAMWKAGSWDEVLGARGPDGTWELPLRVDLLDTGAKASARHLTPADSAPAALQLLAFEQFFPWTASRTLDAAGATRVTKLQLGNMLARDPAASVLTAQMSGSSPVGGLLSNLTLLTSLEAVNVPLLSGVLLAGESSGSVASCRIGPFAPGELLQSVELINAQAAQQSLLPELPAATSIKVVGASGAAGSANLTGWVGAGEQRLWPKLEAVELEFVALPRGDAAFGWLCGTPGSVVETLSVSRASLDSTGPWLCHCSNLQTLRLFNSVPYPDQDGLTSGVTLDDCFPLSFPNLESLDFSSQEFRNPVLPRPSPPQQPPFAHSLRQLIITDSNVQDLGGIGAGLGNLTSLLLARASLVVLPASAAGLLTEFTVGDLPLLQRLFVDPLPGEEPGTRGWSGSLVPDGNGSGLTTELPNLRRLELANLPMLVTWPSHVAMPKLTSLKLSIGVPIESLPALQQQVPLLQTFEAGAGQLRLLPWLGQLPGLVTLTAAQNPGLASTEYPANLQAWDKFSTWPALDSVDLSECGFRSAPFALARAAPFTLLDLQRNPLGAGFCDECVEDIFGSRGFGLFSTPASKIVLDHAFNLPMLPTWVSDANESLTSLFANNVSLTGLPEELCELQQLKDLRMDQNWLQVLPVCMAFMVRPDPHWQSVPRCRFPN